MEIMKTYYTENTSTTEIVPVTVIGGNDRVKQVEYYNNGQVVRGYRVVSELFTNKSKAKSYFK
jgi:hypothetical protein